MRYLPNETWLDILKFVNYLQLAESVSIVNRRFGALADLLCHQELRPRDVKVIFINLSRKYYAHSLHGLLLWRNGRAPPITPPPANINSIKQIFITGLFEHKIFNYLAIYRPKFQHIRLWFRNPANFITALAFSHASIEQFFAALGSSDQITIAIKASSKAPLPLELPGPEFFLSAPVLACRTMEIWLPITDLDSPHGVLSWLITPLKEQGQFRHLAIFGLYQNDQSLANFIDKLISMHLEAQLHSDFMVEILRTLLDLKEFKDGKMSLTKCSSFNKIFLNHGNMAQTSDIYSTLGHSTTAIIAIDDFQIMREKQPTFIPMPALNTVKKSVPTLDGDPCTSSSYSNSL